MAALPEQQPTTAELLLKSYEGLAGQEHRMHLGASIIGHECSRAIWLTHRWAETENLPGQKLRLFESGHLQEPRLVADLRRIGVEVHDTAPDGSQWRVRALGGHFGGSMDGAALGVPEAPKTWHVIEMKTANQKSFDATVKGGVKKAKPQHYAQMTAYMGLTSMDRALYLMVNKNTDEIYSERVRFDNDEFRRIMTRAEMILKMAEPPERISKDPSWYQCGYCKFKDHCHGDQVPEVSCRSCAHSTPDLAGPNDGEGRWLCSNDHLKQMPVISEALQRKGCAEHRFIPIFLQRTAKPIDFIDGNVVYEMADGTTFANGDGTNGTHSSAEIRACGAKALLAETVAIKLEFKQARVVA